MKILPEKTRQRETLEGYLAISPWIIGFLVFVFGPIVASLVLSFHKWNLLKPAQWVGLTNYQSMVSDPLFWQSLKVTFIYAVVSVPLGLVTALLVALLLNQKIKGLAFFRTVFYLPSVMPTVAVSLIWMWMYNPKFGILNFLIKKAGGLLGLNLEGPEWLYSTTWVLPALILMSFWGIGGGMLIFLAGLKNIPEQLYEAALVDGAGAWQRFRKITIPMLSPTIFFLLVTGTIGAFQVFTQAFVMTEGGPLNASMFFVLYLYMQGFRWFRMGYASALAWVLVLIILALTILIFKSSSLWVYYEADEENR
ncbi:ABC transporter permease [candidate division KSB1 bacterium]|nr:sugar ABC transporter permease [bacterium]RKY79078.1 MAG: ABC transporter permease [candidate division KSB1 bacterium]RKY81253.1 MAG: ABC transporter permease [candidate division KSB1 bacterium]RKY86508.1 MAG: ABC transporter permease [candidate division KSB1 bacterium]RKY86665.1 MAG: ABC transporter permease [candidate division KSB1 bacterium]